MWKSQFFLATPDFFRCPKECFTCGKAVEKDLEVFHRKIHRVFHGLSPSFPQSFQQFEKCFYPLISLMRERISECAFFLVLISISTFSIEEMIVE